MFQLEANDSRGFASVYFLGTLTVPCEQVWDSLLDHHMEPNRVS